MSLKPAPIVVLCLALICSSLSAQTQRPTGWDKLTRSARDLAASSGSNVQRNYWVFLNESVIDQSQVAVSERSLVRRAKVDPVGRLIDARDYPVSDAALSSLRALGVEVLYPSRWFRAAAVAATSVQIEQIASLSMVNRVDVAQQLLAPAPPEPKPIKSIPPGPKRSALSYGMATFQTNFIRATKLHDAGYTGNGVMIAFFDTGFETSHPAFDSANIYLTHDFINGDSSVSEYDCNGGPTTWLQTYHGTLTLGVVASNVPDTMVGVAPHADFILAKTEITCNGTEIKMEEYNWIAAAEWADSVGADIITSSLGYFTFQDSGSYTQSQLDGKTALITLAAEAAASKNILVINSAGNDRQNSWGTINFPSDGDSVLAIGATYYDSTVTGFSSPGPTADGRIKPDVSTLGSNVQTVYQFGGYTTSSGTSLSAPLVAGGAALALESDPTMTADELRNLIRQTASLANSPNNDLGYGLYNAAASANILRILPISDISLQVGKSITVPISTTGSASSGAVINAFNLPANASLEDFGDGTAELSLVGTIPYVAERDIIVTATAGTYVDSAQFTVLTYQPSNVSVYAVPNPFAEEMDVYIVGQTPPFWKSITIFTPAGEPVWEKVNNSGPTADVIVKWDGRNLRGERVASGVYLVQVITPQGRTILKVLKTE